RRRRGHHPHASERDLELLGDDLRQRGENALAELDLAGKDFDQALGGELEPLRQAPVGAQAAGQRGGGSARGLGWRIHFALAGFVFASRAARSTARTTRL